MADRITSRFFLGSLSYSEAKDKYAAVGVDTERAIRDLQRIQR